ncbi:hypothetical protein ABZS66_23790 [Dactylosporangium sp. NPDC005572]|uniref:hypothetical protein n=1 Tax=Dactylosporangium sp. NPDC005572 TaxID=3156889 RepID=UPI0033B5A1AC
MDRAILFAKGLAMTAGCHGVLVAVAVGGWLGLSDTPAGAECSGFGCSMTPRDTATLVALFAGLPMFAASALVAIAVVGGLTAARVRSGVLAGVVATAAGWLAAAVVLLVMLQSAVS